MRRLTFIAVAFAIATTTFWMTMLTDAHRSQAFDPSVAKFSIDDLKMPSGLPVQAYDAF